MTRRRSRATFGIQNWSESPALASNDANRNPKARIMPLGNFLQALQEGHNEFFAVSRGTSAERIGVQVMCGLPSLDPDEVRFAMGSQLFNFP